MISCSAYAQDIILNRGVAGNNTNDLLKRIDRDVIADSPYLVIIMIGTNDMANSNKLISYSQYRANYQQIVSKLLNKGTQVMLMSPPPIDTGYLFKRHKRSLFKESPNSKLDSVAIIVREIASKNSLHYVDINKLFKLAGSPNRTTKSLIINEANFDKKDGIHPTKEGYELIAKNVFNYLKKNKLLRGSGKIICFGDSMTYGSFMEGAGTANGNTYPAELKRRIKKYKKRWWSH